MNKSDQLKEKYSSKPNEELVLIAEATLKEYTREAILIAQEELTKRNVPYEQSEVMEKEVEMSEPLDLKNLTGWLLVFSMIFA